MARTWCAAYETAMFLVNESTPALLAEYAWRSLAQKQARERTLMIDPFRFSTMIGTAYLQHRYVPVRLTAMVVFQISSSSSPTGRSPFTSETAAQLKSTSRVENRSMHDRTIACTWPALETSVFTKKASPPSSRIAATVSSPGSSLMSEATTEAPSRANRIALARPIPDPAPVTIATFPFSLIGSSPDFPDRRRGWRRPVMVGFALPAPWRCRHRAGRLSCP